MHTSWPASASTFAKAVPHEPAPNTAAFTTRSSNHKPAPSSAVPLRYAASRRLLNLCAGTRPQRWRAAAAHVDQHVPQVEHDVLGDLVERLAGRLRIGPVGHVDR